MSAARATSAILPATAFYWAILDASDLPANTERWNDPSLRATLDERLQDQLPIAVEELAIAFNRINQASILACALPVSTLRCAVEEQPELLLLAPDAVPPELNTAADAHALNLLNGPFEPPALARAKQRRTNTALAICAVAIALASFGILRRTGHLRSEAATLESEMTDAAAQTSGSRADLERSRRLLESERERLILTRTERAQKHIPTDVSSAVAAILAAWPTDLEVRTQALSATAQGLTIAAELHDGAGGQELATALGSVPGWNLQVPRIRSNGKSVRFDASLQRKAAGGGT